MKVCLSASSGGHFEQLMMLLPLTEKYECFVLTEKTNYSSNINNISSYYLEQVNREETDWVYKMIKNLLYSIQIFFKEKPDVIICTGVLAMIPMCLICKLFGKKMIYIESFAKVNSPTITGKLLYKFSDRFYVQWPQMKRHYPNGIYLGGIY